MFRILQFVFLGLAIWFVWAFLVSFSIHLDPDPGEGALVALLPAITGPFIFILAFLGIYLFSRIEPFRTDAIERWRHRLECFVPLGLYFWTIVSDGWSALDFYYKYMASIQKFDTLKFSSGLFEIASVFFSIMILPFYSWALDEFA